jgi:hypothetical protein
MLKTMQSFFLVMWKAKSWTEQCGIYQHFMHMLVIMLRWGAWQIAPTIHFFLVAVSHTLESRITSSHTHTDRKITFFGSLNNTQSPCCNMHEHESFNGLHFYPKVERRGVAIHFYPKVERRGCIATRGLQHATLPANFNVVSLSFCHAMWRCNDYFSKWFWDLTHLLTRFFMFETRIMWWSVEIFTLLIRKWNNIIDCAWQDLFTFFVQTLDSLFELVFFFPCCYCVLQSSWMHKFMMWANLILVSIVVS